MPDSKITALTSISTSTDPANDPLVIVDVSDTSMAATGTTKKVTLNQLLGASGTATLASATITGDLTVDTSTLVVNSSQNRVGIGFSGNASSGRLQISQPLGSTIDGALRITDDATTSFVFNNVSSGVSGIWSSGAIAFGVGSGTFTEAMRLNSTGLGVGVASPAFKLDVAGSAGSGIRFTGNSVQNVIGETGGNGLVGTVSNHNLGFYTNATLRALIDTSGNVGIGVTPSAWNTIGPVLQIEQASLVSESSNQLYLSANAYFASGNWNYINNSQASQYYQSAGSHVWRSATASTGAISFSTLMTLDASGNLLVATTNASFGTANGFRTGDTGGRLELGSASSTNANIGFDMYSTGAAAYRFYVGWGGTVFATNTTISAISDARLKENVQDIDVGLGAILALKPRKFDWKAGKGKDIKGDRGFIAQEFEQVFPNLIDEWKDAAPEGEAPYKSVRQDLIPVLVKAIQELTARVQTLETR